MAAMSVGPADADRADCRLARVRLHPGGHFVQILRRKRASRRDPLRRVGDERHRLEILHHVVLQGLGRRVDDVRLHMAEAERVAVGRRARHATDPDGAAGAAHVLDDDGLAEQAPHRLAQDARQGVRWSAGRIRHDQRDRARRIDLRRCGADRRLNETDSEGDGEEWHSHGWASPFGLVESRRMRLAQSACLFHGKRIGRRDHWRNHSRQRLHHLIAPWCRFRVARPCPLFESKE